MNDKREKWIELAKKLKVLSERGIGGEKDNALSKLNLIMKKYGLSIDDVDGNLKRNFDFDLPKDITDNFMVQILSSITGDLRKVGIEFGGYKKVRKRGFKSHYINRIEPCLFSEFIIKVELFWNHYQKEKKVFYEAYIQANSLYTKADENNERDVVELTLEERERQRKVRGMMEGIDKVNYLKRLK